ncbi:dynein intermediate chain 2 [Achlya hypogyna]|uniref:Dynein intermediate chain 2 n=1 Tax=Achlya hypogyna TaxID=1202772 RepID=A0A1V9YR29_ACHHY|nr:dynein intermediate chain 2 [Achlya hypogyna]
MPNKVKAASPTKKKAKEPKASDAVAADAPKGDAPAQTTEPDDADIYHEPVKKIVIPDNQLRLNEQELKEEFSRVLTANDPNVPNNVTKYNYKERMYKVDPPGPGDNLHLHLALEGSMIHKESEDAKAQAAYDMKKAEEEKEARDAAIKQAKEEADAKGEKLDETALQFESGKNQFNYSERAAQTYTNPLRQRSVETEPPPVLNYMATVTQWDIYDTYMEAYEQHQREQIQLQKAAQKKEKEEKDGADVAAAATTATTAAAPGKAKDDDMVHSAAMGMILRVVERMVNQNAEDEIFQDFKYWEDASDAFREGEGSLLPLWRFASERAKKKQVTAVCWNPCFADLFAVGYGSYEFLKQGSGLVCCYTLKNTSHAEFTFATESGVMCLDFHPQQPALLAVGCYDGTVLVYDVRNKVNRPIYASTIKTGKHTDPVWQVYWQEEDLAKELNFFSISSDGRVANWIMSKNELKMEPVMQLKLVNTVKDDPEETSLSGLAGGCCFDFNRFSEHLFIVGTEEGKIHKCSKAYSGQYLETYGGHHMAVYAVRWNPFHDRCFLSCSADWTVKLWDHSLPEPIMSFDLGNSVGDVAWAPYSSTVFAAVTSDGKVHVFDLAENKNEPLCEQKVVKRAKLTHVTFNSRESIVLVGDDRGGVNSLKLSPNLRKVTPVDGEEASLPLKLTKDRLRTEHDKVEKLLSTNDNKA